MQEIPNAPNFSLEYKYKYEFPRLESYNDLDKIINAFPSLKGLKNEFHSEDYQGSNFIVIRSNSVDDIHKAIKYGYWNFGKKNERMQAIYQNGMKNGYHTIVLFMLKGENTVYGAAEINSILDKTVDFYFWWDHQLIKGVFHLKWIFVKNLTLDLISYQDENGKDLRGLKDGE